MAVDAFGPLRHSQGGEARSGMGRAEREVVGDAGSTGFVLDLDTYVPGLLTFVANKLSRSASALYRREFGVNVTEWRVLAQLAIEPGVTAARICQVIGFDKGPVSRTLGAMEQAGLIEARGDPADSRRRLVALTAGGRALHDRIITVALERERRLLSCLDDAEQATLIGYLNRLHANLPAVTKPIAVPPARE